MDHPNNDKTDSKSGHWFVTVNNPTSQDEDVIGRLTETGLLPKIHYCKWAVEDGEANHTRHMHVYLHCTPGTQQRFSAVLKCWPKSHVEEPVGTPAQQISYVGNPDFIYSERNPDESKRGKRKGGTCEYKKEYGTTEGIRLNQTINSAGTVDLKLIALKKLIDAGSIKHELYESDFPTMIKYGGRLEEYYNIIRATKTPPGMMREHELMGAEHETRIAEAVHELLELQDNEIEAVF